MIFWLMAALACGDSEPTTTPAPPEPAAEPTPPAEPPKAEVPPAEEAKPPQVYRDWDELLANDCDLSHKSRVWNPLELRILRNAPYARKGWRFSAPELAAYFAAVDSSYSPGESNDAITLDAKEQACVETLKAAETKLREGVDVPPEAERRMIADPEGYRAWTYWRGGGEDFYKFLSFTKQPDGGWTMGAPNPGCYQEAKADPDVDCGGNFLVCPGEEEPCFAAAPG